MVKQIEEKLASLEVEFSQVQNYTGGRASYLKGYIDAIKWVLSLFN